MMPTNDAARAYIDAIDPEHRPMFDRLQRLILEAYPDAEGVLSYGMPTYKVGRRRLHVGVWKHGLSFYGLGADNDGGFSERHPEMRTSKGTIQLPSEAAAAIPDDELRDLIHAVLGGGSSS
jgi:uncharacterized protein YdhG (YjbR/CyaY superfamily)